MAGFLCCLDRKCYELPNGNGEVRAVSFRQHKDGSVDGTPVDMRNRQLAEAVCPVLRGENVKCYKVGGRVVRTEVINPDVPLEKLPDDIRTLAVRT